MSHHLYRGIMAVMARPSTAREMQAPYVTSVAARGRFVIPASVRGRLGWREGDEIVLTVQRDGSLRVRSVRQVVESTAGIFKHLAPRRRLVAELLRERRKEARREDHD